MGSSTGRRTAPALGVGASSNGIAPALRGGASSDPSREGAHAARASDRQLAEAAPQVNDALTTSTLAAWAWVRLGEQYGIAVAEVAEAAGVSEGELRDPGVFLSQRGANRAAELMFMRVGPNAAMLAAQLLDRGHFALPELVVRSAPTVHDAMLRSCEVFPLLHRGSCLVPESMPGRTIVRWQRTPGLDVHPGYIELVFAVCVQGIRRETGRERAQAAATWFEHTGPEETSEHARVLGPVRFGAPETRLELSAETLSLPMLRASASAHSSAVTVATEALQSNALGFGGRSS